MRLDDLFFPLWLLFLLKSDLDVGRERDKATMYQNGQ